MRGLLFFLFVFSSRVGFCVSVPFSKHHFLVGLVSVLLGPDQTGDS